MKLLLLPVTALVLCLTACDDNDDKTKDVDKTGSIEVSLHTAHIDSLKDLLTTHYIVWSKGTKVKEFDVKDTVPALGKTTTEGENDSGDTRNITAQRDYQFFVTVK